jgi:hypothetical protein
VIKDETVTEPESIEIVIPDEPPQGSVVIDRFGLAWQRRGVSAFGMHWCVAGRLGSIFPNADAPQLTWGHLLLQRGPVTLVFSPEKNNTREDTK